MTERARGERMRRLALHPRLFDQIGDFGYTDGGCRIYAEAVCELTGAILAYVIAEGNGWGPIVDHAVAINGDWVFDGRGAVPLEEYLAHYGAIEDDRSGVTLELLHAEEVEEDPLLRRQARALPVNHALSTALATVWREAGL
jgi:hypothetical protein